MAQINIAICDLCGAAYEVSGQLHGAELRITVFEKNLQCISEDFQMCHSCLNESGLLEVIKNMKKRKEKNEAHIKNISKNYLSTREGQKLIPGLVKDEKE